MNKKKIMSGLIAALAAAGSMTVLAQESTTEAASGGSADYYAQLTSFVNQVSVWKPKAKASYAYSDLDQNGELEIITCYDGRRGVSDDLWELQDGKLTQAQLPWGDDDDQPALIESSVPAYYDADADVYYYVFGTASEEEDAPVTVVSYKDGVLNAEALEEDPDTRFDGMEKMTASFGWISTAEHTLNDAPLEQLKELGGESIGAFKVEKAQ